jgi:hypothetical protein
LEPFSGKPARRAAGDPEAAARALGRAIDLREALYTLMSSVVDRRKPEKPQLTRLNDYVAETFGAAHLAVKTGA